MKKITFNGLGRNVLFDDDEYIIWQEKPSRLNYIIINNMIPTFFAAIWLIFDSIGIIAVILSIKDNPGLISTLLFFAIHMMPVWLWIGSAIKLGMEYDSINYVVTNKKIISTDSKTTLKIGFQEVTDVTFTETKFSKRGDITFKGKGQPIKFCGLKNASKQYSTIRLIIDNIQQK